MPLVSVAIRAYRSRWLGEAIESVLGQTHDDLELVVYDDSGENADIVRRFTRDPRIRYHRAPARLGASGRYAAALALCHGEYVGLLDDDDRYAPEFVARVVAPLEADATLGLAFARVTWEFDGGRASQAERVRPGAQPGAARRLLTTCWCPVPSQTLIRRAALDAVQRERPLPDGVAPDLYVSTAVAADGWGLYLVDAPLVVKRFHAGQLIRFPGAFEDLLVATYAALRFHDTELEALRAQALARALVRRASFHLRTGRRADARADLEAARAADPRAWRPLRRVARAAAAIPVVGVASTRALFALPAMRRRRELPPGSPPRSRIAAEIARRAGDAFGWP
jgi:glycosyltransferase involved in cell wall biosynthesis